MRFGQNGPIFDAHYKIFEVRIILLRWGRGGLSVSRQAKASRSEGEPVFAMARAAPSPLPQKKSKLAGWHGPISAPAVVAQSTAASSAAADRWTLR
jgi:hypothetical protein